MRYVMRQGELVPASEAAVVGKAKRSRCDMSEHFANTPPPFKRHFSYIHGRRLRSWGEYHDANKEMNLVDTGRKPGLPSETGLPESPKIGIHTQGERCAGPEN